MRLGDDFGSELSKSKGEFEVSKPLLDLHSAFVTEVDRNTLDTIADNEHRLLISVIDDIEVEFNTLSFMIDNLRIEASVFHLMEGFDFATHFNADVFADANQKSNTLFFEGLNQVFSASKASVKHEILALSTLAKPTKLEHERSYRTS